jgi:hypothetical protein
LAYCLSYPWNISSKGDICICLAPHSILRCFAEEWIRECGTGMTDVLIGKTSGAQSSDLVCWPLIKSPADAMWPVCGLDSFFRQLLWDLSQATWTSKWRFLSSHPVETWESSSYPHWRWSSCFLCGWKHYHKDLVLDQATQSPSISVLSFPLEICSLESFKGF